MEISKQLASQIVHAVYDVVGNNINFINPSGVIIGSTDAARIGTFHEAGRQALETGVPVIADDNHTFMGTRKGINYPIFLDSVPIAAIGITGIPEELQQFGFLITKITEVFLKEQKLNEELLSETRSLQYLITSLIYDNIQNQKQLDQLFDHYKVDFHGEYAALSIKMLDTTLEPALRFYFSSIGCQLSLYLYPNEWVVLFDKESFTRFSSEEFSLRFKEQLCAGMGTFGSLYQLHQSYSNALSARGHALQLNRTFYTIEDISMDFILDSLPENIQKLYACHLLSTLNEKEKHLLKQYFIYNLSLADTASALFIHKNTLQYQLNRIAEKTGLNPRLFQDAFLLQFAILCDK